MPPRSKSCSLRKGPDAGNAGLHGPSDGTSELRVTGPRGHDDVRAARPGSAGTGPGWRASRVSSLGPPAKASESAGTSSPTVSLRKLRSSRLPEVVTRLVTGEDGRIHMYVARPTV